MKQNEKLKLVFDFIADYLSEEVTEEVVKTPEVTEEPLEDRVFIQETENNDNTANRSYQIMKKIDELDRRDAEVNRAVKIAVDPFKKALKEAKSEYIDKVTEDKVKDEEKLKEEFQTKTGVTLDDNGNLVSVEVQTLTDNRTNKEVLEEVGVDTGAIIKKAKTIKTKASTRKRKPSPSSRTRKKK